MVSEHFMLSGKHPSRRDLFIISVNVLRIMGRNAFSILLLMLSKPELFLGLSSSINLDTSCSEAGVKYIVLALVGIF